MMFENHYLNYIMKPGNTVAYATYFYYQDLFHEFLSWSTSVISISNEIHIEYKWDIILLSRMMRMRIVNKVVKILIFLVLTAVYVVNHQHNIKRNFLRQIIC